MFKYTLTTDPIHAESSGSRCAAFERAVAMRLNLEMLDWGLRRLWFGMNPDIRTMATNSRELCEEETEVVPPAIHAPGELDRVIRLAPHRTWATEHMLTDGGACVHAASMAHDLEGVAISGAYIYRGPAKYKPGFGPEKIFTGNPPPMTLDSACLVSNNIGSHYFGNFLLDDSMEKNRSNPSECGSTQAG